MLWSIINEADIFYSSKSICQTILSGQATLTVIYAPVIIG